MSALWISALAETAVRSTALLGIAALLTLVLCRRSAAIRHLVWGLALAGVLILPLAGAVLPGVPVPVPQALADALPASPVATADVAPTRESLPLAPPATDPRVGMRYSAASGTATNAADAAPARLAPAAESPAVGGSPPPESAAASATAASATAASAAIPWGPVLLTIWSIGAAAFAAWVLASVRNTRRLAADAADVTSPEWLDLLREVLAHLGIRSPVRLLQSERALTPMTWGWRRPVVVVPAAASGWSRERRSVVLRHELAHVRRGDFVTQMLARSVCALYWFNPAVWFAVYRLRVERERACDDEVLRLGTRASDYANHLLDIARERHAPGLRASAAVAMAQRSQLEGRMRAILDPRVRRTATRSSTVLATAVLTGAVLAASAVTPTAQSRGSAVPVAPGDQKPRTETDVVVAVPQSPVLPASKAQPRARDLRPVGAFSAATAARSGEEQSQVNAPTENVAQTNAGNGDGQDAGAAAAAVESQQRELEELYEEARRLHEEALRQAEQMRRQAERVLARDLEGLRRHVEDTRALLEGARKDDAGKTSEVQQRSDLAPAAVESQSRTPDELYEDLKEETLRVVRELVEAGRVKSEFGPDPRIVELGRRAFDALEALHMHGDLGLFVYDSDGEPDVHQALRLLDLDGDGDLDVYLVRGVRDGTAQAPDQPGPTGLPQPTEPSVSPSPDGPPEPPGPASPQGAGLPSSPPPPTPLAFPPAPPALPPAPPALPGG